MKFLAFQQWNIFALRSEDFKMPKMKTNKAAKKRFKKTATGEFKREKAYKSHILTKKSSKRKRNLGKKTIVHKVDKKAISKLLPYS